MRETLEVLLAPGLGSAQLLALDQVLLPLGERARELKIFLSISPLSLNLILQQKQIFKITTTCDVTGILP